MWACKRICAKTNERKNKNTKEQNKTYNQKTCKLIMENGHGDPYWTIIKKQALNENEKVKKFFSQKLWTWRFVPKNGKPTTYFRLFFTNKLLNVIFCISLQCYCIFHQTNFNRQQSKPNQAMSSLAADKIDTFSWVVIPMASMKRPKVTDYWQAKEIFHIIWLSSIAEAFQARIQSLKEVSQMIRFWCFTIFTRPNLVKNCISVERFNT